MKTSLVVETLCFHCRVRYRDSTPGWGTKITHAMRQGPKKKKKKKTEKKESNHTTVILVTAGYISVLIFMQIHM